MNLNPNRLAPDYEMVELTGGANSIRSVACGETFHPAIGPAAEAEALYARQLRLPERMAEHAGEFVVWDVGLGAAANALAVLRLTGGARCRLRILSFDHTLEPLQFALRHADDLGYFQDYEEVANQFANSTNVEFTDSGREVVWNFHGGDFPLLLAAELERRKSGPALPAPHAIMFDPYSPARNPGMWTQGVFERLFQFLDPSRPCALATYSRSTLIRVSLLLSGFLVGAGHPSGAKEETTVAANSRELLASPLDQRWLERARRSHAAEPLREPAYRQAPLSEETWERLRQHPQFN